MRPTFARLGLPRPQLLAAVVLAAVVLAAVVLTAGCGVSVQVHSAFDPGKNFSTYRTFAMLEPNKPVQTDNPDVNPFVLQRLRQIAYSRLKERGFVPVERKDADLVVHIMAGVKERLEMNSTNYYGYAWRGPAFNYNWQQYQEGTVVLDLIDAKANAVVWRGSGVRRVVTEPSNAELGEVIDRILSQYPPGKAAQ